MIRQAFGEESTESQSSPRPKRGETDEEQSQEHAHHFP
jgi:hypothetical protein